MKKLEFNKESFHPSVVSREYKPFDEIAAAQKAQEIFDVWYNDYETEKLKRLEDIEKSNNANSKLNSNHTPSPPTNTFPMTLTISEVLQGKPTPYYQEEDMNTQLETEMLLRQKLKELKKKSNSRRNALRHIEKALKLRTYEYKMMLEINKALLARNNELLAEFELLEQAFEEFKSIAEEQQSIQKPWWKLW